LVERCRTRPIAHVAAEMGTPVSHRTVNRHLVELNQKGILMLRQVRCGCGYLARGDSADQVISLVIAHIATDHPDLAETETPDDIRSWIELVPD
jgi:predicted small metal-binding protein